MRKERERQGGIKGREIIKDRMRNQEKEENGEA